MYMHVWYIIYLHIIVYIELLLATRHSCTLRAKA